MTYCNSKNYLSELYRKLICLVWEGEHTGPEKLLTHGVYCGDVVWPDIAVIQRCVGLRRPVGVTPVQVGADL